MLVGEQEKILDQLEPLLKIPYYFSPGRLKIDPNFGPLRKTPRFQKLVERAYSITRATAAPFDPLRKNPRVQKLVAGGK